MSHQPPRAEITAEQFKAATGNTPIDDDLERCNCELEGLPGHWHCGWNHTLNKPNFYLRMEQVEEDRRKRGVPLMATPLQ